MSAPRADGVPAVSVIVANYNGARFLEAALRSALAQTLRGLEVIVADDGSTDDSVARIERLGAADARLRLLAPAGRGGPAAARNRCLAAARGRWIAVLDSDDLMHPERLERLVGAAERDGADIAADDMLMFDEDLAIPPRPCLRGRDARTPRWIGLAAYVAANTMFRRRAPLGYLKPVIRAAALQGAAARYDESLRIGEDYDLVARLLAAGARFRVYPELTYFYRRHAASISHRLPAAAIGALLVANERFVAAYGSDAPGLRGALAERAAMLRRALAFDRLVQALRQRRWADALARAARDPMAAMLLRQPVAAWLGRARAARQGQGAWPPGPPLGAAPPDPQSLECGSGGAAPSGVRGRSPWPCPSAVILSRQRLVGRDSGSSAYLLDLAEAVAESGVAPHLVAPSPALFGRTPVLRLRPDMRVFASIAVHGAVRIGDWLIATRPEIWLRGLRGIAGRALARAGLPVAALDRTAPYAVAVPWTRADQVFVARRARRHGDVVIADYAFVTPGIAYALRPDAVSLVVMHDLFSSRAGQFERIGAADSVAALEPEREMRLLGLADAVIAIQPDEAAVVGAALPGRQVLVAPMAVRTVAAAQPGVGSGVLFVGSRTAPNVVGLRAFLDGAWPLIRAAVPAARLEVCGGVGAAVGALPEGVTALGYVADLDPLYRAAAVVIAPLPAGSGLKIKLIEALGQGKAVVATEAALQGVAPAAAAAVWRADGTAATAGAVIRLLGDPDLRARHAAAALAAARDCYAPACCRREVQHFIRSALFARMTSRDPPVTAEPRSAAMPALAAADHA